MANPYQTGYYQQFTVQQQSATQAHIYHTANANSQNHKMAAAAATAAALAASRATGQTATAAASVNPFHGDGSYAAQVQAAQNAATHLQQYYSATQQPMATITQTSLIATPTTSVAVTGNSTYAQYLAMNTNSATTQALMSQMNMTAEQQIAYQYHYQTVYAQAPQIVQYGVQAVQPAAVQVQVPGTPLFPAYVAQPATQPQPVPPPPPPPLPPQQSYNQRKAIVGGHHHHHHHHPRPYGRYDQPVNAGPRGYDRNPNVQSQPLYTHNPGYHPVEEPGQVMLPAGELNTNVPGSMARLGRTLNTDLESRLKSAPKRQVDVRMCEVCKVECIGVTSYQQHISGRKHALRISHQKEMKALKSFIGPVKGADGSLTETGKKSQNDTNSDQTIDDSAILKLPSSTLNSMKNVNIHRYVTTKSAIILRCQLCNIMCVSVDAYFGHLKGTKHLRTRVNQEQKKEPIPSCVPDIISTNVAPGIRYAVIEEFTRYESQLNKDPKQVAYELANMPGPGSTKASEELGRLDQADFNKPVGQDFIEEVLNEGGKTVCFMCTLCEVRFNDTFAKTAHLKGKKHRIAYKKKVDPQLIVLDIKSDRRKVETQFLEKEQKHSKNFENMQYVVDINPFDELWKTVYQWKITDYLEDLQTLRSQQTSIDYGYRSVSDYFMELKHKKVVAPREMMEKIHMIVGIVEMATGSVAAVVDQVFLQLDSEELSDEVRAVKSQSIDMELFTKMFNTGRFIQLVHDYEEELATSLEMPDSKVIKMIRVGALGKGYILVDDQLVDVVLNCNFFPTESLLHIFVSVLPLHLNLMQDEFHFEVEKEDAGFRLTATGLTPETGADLSDPIKTFTFQVRATFTSGFIRNADQVLVHKVKGLLNRERCLDALCEVRRIRWFKEKLVTPVSKGVIHPHFQFIVRIIRSIYKQIKCFETVPDYTIELQLERICHSVGFWPPVVSLVRHFFEAIAYGVLSDKVGIGIGDPCQYNFPDSYSVLSLQVREYITGVAGQIIRQCQLRQLPRVLSLDPKEAKDVMPKRKNLTNVPKNQEPAVSAAAYYKRKIEEINELSVGKGPTPPKRARNCEERLSPAVMTIEPVREEDEAMERADDAERAKDYNVFAHQIEASAAEDDDTQPGPSKRFKSDTELVLAMHRTLSVPPTLLQN